MTEEFIIISKKQKGSEYRQSSYAEAGDSGSLVISMEGQVCGLLYGATTGLTGPPGLSNMYANTGLAIGFPELSNSIKLRSMIKDDDGNTVEPPAELGLPDGFTFDECLGWTY